MDDLEKLDKALQADMIEDKVVARRLVMRQLLNELLVINNELDNKKSPSFTPLEVIEEEVTPSSSEQPEEKESTSNQEDENTDELLDIDISHSDSDSYINKKLLDTDRKSLENMFETNVSIIKNRVQYPKSSESDDESLTENKLNKFVNDDEKYTGRETKARKFRTLDRNYEVKHFQQKYLRPGTRGPKLWGSRQKENKRPTLRNCRKFVCHKTYSRRIEPEPPHGLTYKNYSSKQLENRLKYFEYRLKGLRRDPKTDRGYTKQKPGYYKFGDYRPGTSKSGRYKFGDRKSGDPMPGVSRARNFSSREYMSGGSKSRDPKPGVSRVGKYSSRDFMSGDHKSEDPKPGVFRAIDSNSGDGMSGGSKSGDYVSSSINGSSTSEVWQTNTNSPTFERGDYKGLTNYSPKIGSSPINKRHSVVIELPKTNDGGRIVKQDLPRSIIVVKQCSRETKDSGVCTVSTKANEKKASLDEIQPAENFPKVMYSKNARSVATQAGDSDWKRICDVKKEFSTSQMKKGFLHTFSEENKNKRVKFQLQPTEIIDTSSTTSLNLADDSFVPEGCCYCLPLTICFRYLKKKLGFAQTD